MKKIEFYNEADTQNLWEKGSQSFQLLNEEQINALKEIFYSFHTEVPGGFYATSHMEDAALRKKISDAASEIVIPALAKIFVNGNVLGGAFIAKSPGKNGMLPLHQDWNLVDESVARSYNLWIPLMDVDEHNGTMYILPGSHTKQHTFRGPKVMPVLHAIAEHVFPFMEPLRMKAGEALLYDHALWHYSPENISEELRLVLVLGITPNNVDFRYYEMEGDEVLEYASYAHFLLEKDRNAGPEGLELIRRFTFPNVPLSLPEFKRIYTGEIVTEKGFFARLFQRN